MSNLVDVKRIEGGSPRARQANKRFRAVFKNSPENQEISDAQQQAGYHPAGYGGPMVISRKQLEDGTWEVIFECYGSCD